MLSFLLWLRMSSVTSMSKMFYGLIFFFINMANLLFGLIQSHPIAHNFFLCICKTAHLLKPNMWMNTIDLVSTSFMFDPWYFEIPLDFKPTYLNMELDLFSINLTELIVDVHQNLHELHNIFGDHLNTQALALGNNIVEGLNNWVWFPNSKGIHLSNNIHSFLNSPWKICCTRKARRYFGNSKWHLRLSILFGLSSIARLKQKSKSII